MTADLVAFLREQLDAEEQIARAVEDHSAPWDGQWVADGTDALRTYNGHVLFYGHSGPLKSGLVAHVARHDPARVLAEITAKRAIVDHIADELDATDSPWWYDDKLTFILQQLALPYAHHPDYRPEWAPDA